MIGLAKLFVVIHAITNDLLPLEICRKNAYCSLLTKIIRTSLSILIILVICAILLPFAVLRICIGIILKILHRKSYGGLLTGLDTLFEMFPNKTVINVINIYASKEDPTITSQKVKDIVYQIYCSSFKFSSNIQRFLGYCYYLKDQVNFEEVVDIIRYNNEEYMSKEMLFNYLEENCLTLKDNQMWKVVIFSQPISWTRSNTDEYKQYAIIWTLRHSLGDGPSIITIFQKHANEDGFKMDTTKFEKLKKNMSSKISLDNVYLRRNPVTTKLDGLALKIPDNTKWYAVSFMETRPKYIAVIKRIKDELNVNFTEVISAAIIASVHDYIKQRKVTLNNFTIAKVIRLKSEDLLKLKKGAYKFEEIKNNFGFIAFQLPTNLKGKNVKDIIEYLQQYNKSLRNAVDPLVASTVLDQICTYLPINLSRVSCTSFMDSMTIGVTNLVGFKSSTLCGNTIDDVFFFTPGVLNTAFTFSIFSYDDRLQIILTSREGFVHNREELQHMLDNVFMYINRVQEEILLTN